MDNWPEKRKYRRLSKPFVTRFQERLADNWDIVTLQNLSAGGAIFNYNKRLVPGSYLDLKIDFPRSDKAIECEAHVVRVEEPYFPPSFGIGIEFVDLDQTKKSLIDKFVKELNVKPA